MPQKGEFKKNAKPESLRKRAYNAQPEQKKRRAERNSSRAEMAKKYGKAAIKGKDVDHKNHNTSDKSAKNLSLMSPSKNRAMNQHDPRMKRKK